VINTTGLYLTKHGGAVLNSISFSLLLPITTILFSVPLLGEFRESIFPATYVGIVVLITGFAMWRYFQAQHDALLAELAARESAAAKDLTRTREMSHQPASRSALWESVDSFVALPTTNDGRLGPASRPSRSRRTHLPIASDIFNLSFKAVDGSFSVHLCKLLVCRSYLLL
jgi:hypothetical protein